MRSDKKSSKVMWIRQYIPLYIMLIPSLIYIFINNYLPMGGLVLAFKKYNLADGIWGSKWIGLKNFTFITRNKSFARIVLNTVGYNVAFTVVNLIVGVFLAVLISEIPNRRLQKTAQSVVLFPFVISIVIVSYIVRGFLDAETGLLNSLREAIGLSKISWYDVSRPWPFILIYVNLWKGVGYGVILYISTIFSIDPSLFEVASLEGATKWQKIKYITLPFLKPTIITLLLLNCGRIFNSDFGIFYQVPQDSGLIQNVTQTIDTFVYRALIQQNNIGLSSAASFLQSIFGFLMVMIFNGITRKVSSENALF